MSSNLSPVEQLRAVVPQLSAGDAAFASDMLKFYDKNARLSDRQFFWVDKLIKRATAPAPTTQTLAVSVARVFELFATARAQGLKYPKIRLQAPDGGPVVFAQSGAKSKFEGQVQVTDGQRFGSNRYFGRIDKDGVLYEGRDLDADVRELITNLAADPEGVASIHGHRTGECCFCRTALTDARSVEVGFGPVCAKKFGLSWGKAAVKTVHVEVEEQQ
jgi:hypothetical protein